MRRLTRRSIIIGGGILAVAGAAAGTAAMLIPREQDIQPVFVADGAAIRGTDPVAYFTESRAVAGRPEFSTLWNGAEWHFASVENRDTFRANPSAYAPQFGGFCAWAVAEKGRLYTTQPENWSIADGKLYLNFNDSIQQRWEADTTRFIADGHRRWPEILASKS